MGLLAVGHPKLSPFQGRQFVVGYDARGALVALHKSVHLQPWRRK